MKQIILIISLLAFTGFAHAEETMGEKAEAKTKDVHRSMKKGAHRAEEKMCGKLTGEAKTTCMAKKAKHRVEETKDAVKDEASEMKNKMDSDKK